MKLSRTHPQVKELLANTYPDYNGREIELVEHDTYYMQDYWSGGTRYYVQAVNLADLSTEEPKSFFQNPFNQQAHASFLIPDGYAMVEHIYFFSRDLGIRINVNKNTYPKLLAEAK